ncbi:hypothetical protein EDF81_0063 [Enterobacter sp. BIGb0383]|uniref:hypothetical protein n=1 Tax=unclassified Enterobacter TaxID=2608935 RepID=UPI000F488DB0|nr:MULTISPECIES: hypothetical protein [unclassified Enterobacter]ROP61592.1 hypothetical protein EDF81_0063 [Enterobacter sp. BIGb0383]ROS11753.1 hypothetical protein EC848_0063 [Enterobacter sp. BIGb0359]
MNVVIHEDSLVVGRYAFTDVGYHYDVIDGEYDIRFNLMGANEGQEWTGLLMSRCFYDGFRKLVRSEPEYLHMYKGINCKVLEQLLKDFIIQSK